jgi:hypothetical protein
LYTDDEQAREGWTMSILRDILDDLLNKRCLESYATIACGVVLLLVSVLGGHPAVATNAILAAVLVVLYSNVLRAREAWPIQPKQDISGISAFHKDRGVEAHLIARLLPKARHEIAMLAVQFSSVVHDYLGALAEKAEEGCQIKILMMAPRDAQGNVNPNVEAYESQRTYTNLLSRLDDTANTLARWVTSLAPSIRKQIEIKQYLEHPTVSMFFIDRADVDGFLRVEVLPYKADAHDFPNYHVRRRDDEGFYDFHSRSFDLLWKKSMRLKTSAQAGLLAEN